jgi:hypothetical protein
VIVAAWLLAPASSGLGCAFLIELVLLPFGAAFFFGGCYDFVRKTRLRKLALRCQQWPAVPGVVRESGILTHEHTILGAPADSYIPWAKYEYVVNNVTYRSDCISYVPNAFGGSAGAEAALLPYAPGAAIWVFHDPIAPSTAVLERAIPGFGPRLQSLVAVFVGFVIGGFCVLDMSVQLLTLAFRR